MTDTPDTGKPFTGRKMLILTVSAFAVIIAVNVFMAVMAVGTFPGLETKNSYVASQQFDKDRAAQLALGWRVSAEVRENQLHLTILDVNGAPVLPEIVDATLGRATEIADDRTPAFQFDGRAMVADVDLAPGNWNLRLVARAADGTNFRQRIVIHVDNPA